jgi:hypothetical protein
MDHAQHKCSACGGSGDCSARKGTSNGGKCTLCDGTGKCPNCQRTGRKPAHDLKD